MSQRDDLQGRQAAPAQAQAQAQAPEAVSVPHRVGHCTSIRQPLLNRSRRSMAQPRRSRTTAPPALDGVPMSQALRALAERGTAKRVAKGQRLIEEDDLGSTIYIIISGRLRAFSSSPGGEHEVTYGEYLPGEYLGEMSLDGGTRSANVEAVVPSWVLTITLPTLHSHIAERPEFAFELLSKVIRRARAATLSLRAVALNDVYGRVVWLLNGRAELQPDGSRVAGPLTHLEMARLLGCTKSMISKVLKELESGGYVACADHCIQLRRTLPSRF